MMSGAFFEIIAGDNPAVLYTIAAANEQQEQQDERRSAHKKSLQTKTGLEGYIWV